MSDVKSEYILEIVNKPSSPLLIDALDVYLRNTNSTVRTPTNEILYWAGLYNDNFRAEKNELMMFAFCKNKTVIGYAQMVYFSKERLLVIDHVAIDEHFRHGLGTFFEFIDQMKQYISTKKLEIDNVVTEIGYHSDDEEPHQESRTLIRLLKFVGFSVAKARYSQPLLGMNNHESQIRAVLMFLRQDPAKTIKHETYMEVVFTIYYKHYMRWYAPFPETNIQKYQAHLDHLYHEIETSMTGKPVVLNGMVGFAEEGIRLSNLHTTKRGRKGPFIVVLLLMTTMSMMFVLAHYLNFSGNDAAMLVGTSIILVIVILTFFTDRPVMILERLLQKLGK